MMLRGFDFGPCIDASGTRNFFGEGYWYHHIPLLRSLWYTFEGSTFTSKTTNYEVTEGNMPLTEKFQPRELFPKCIWIDFLGNKALNAVGLSSPGAEVVFSEGLSSGRWPREAFMISIAPEGTTTLERIKSFSHLVGLLRKYKWPSPHNGWAIQINISCPNGKVKPSELIYEAGHYLDMVADLEIPVVIKVNLLVAVEVLKGIAGHPACDALCLTNTLPFGELPERVPWKKWFPNGSPLKKFGGGGLSGAPLFPLLLERVQEIKQAKIDIPLIAGGGIMHPDQVNKLVCTGLIPKKDAVSIGSIAFLRPWNIPATIDRAHELLG